MRPNQSWLPDLRVIDFPAESLVTASEKKKLPSSFNRPLLFHVIMSNSWEPDPGYHLWGRWSNPIKSREIKTCNMFAAALKMSVMIQSKNVLRRNTAGKRWREWDLFPWSQYWEPGVIWCYKVLIRSYKVKYEVHYCTNPISCLEWGWEWGLYLKVKACEHNKCIA